MHALQYQYLWKEYLQSLICILYVHFILSFYTSYLHAKHCNIIIYLRLDMHACTLHILCGTFYPLIMLSVVVVLYSSQHNGSQKLQWMSLSTKQLLFTLNIFHSYLYVCMQESHCAVSLQFPTQLYASFITLLSTKVLLCRYTHGQLLQTWSYAERGKDS